MTDIPLIVQADTSSVAKGKGDLEGFKKALGGVGEATDKVTGSSERGKAASRGYTDQQRQATTESKKASQAAMEQATAVDRVSQAYRVGKAAIAGFIGMAIVRDLQNTTMSLQKIDMTFQAVTGSAEGAATEMNYVRTTADALGQDVLTAAGAYAKLLAATKGTNITLEESRNVFEGITAAATAYGLSQYELEGALMAVQQMISKGSVQAEELRGQLGERLPGAFQIAARSMNMTTQELSKALEGGQVSAEDFVRAFGNQLQMEFAGFAQTAQTAGRAVNELENSMLLLKEAVIDGGFRNAFFMVLNALNGIAQSDGAQAAARALGAAFDLLAQAVEIVLSLFEKLANSAIITAAFNLISEVLGVLADNMDVVIAAAGILGAIFLTGPLVTGLAALGAAIAPAVAGLIMLYEASGVLGVAMTLLSGPVGIVLGIIAALAAAYYLLKDRTISVEDATQNMTQAMDDVKTSAERLKGLQDQLIEGYYDMGVASATGSKAQETAAAANIASIQREIEEQNKLMETQRVVLQGRIADAKASTAKANKDLGLEAYTGQNESLNDRVDSGEITASQKLEEQRKIQKMANDELIEYRRQQLVLEVELGKELSERERLFLNEATAIMVGNQAIKEMEKAHYELGNSITRNAAETEKLRKQMVEMGQAKQLIDAVAGGFNAMTRAMTMTQADAQALDAALQDVFAAKNPQAMADAIRTVQASLKASGQEGGQLSTALDTALGILGAMEGVNIAGPIAAALAPASQLAGLLAAAAANYSALRANTGQSGPDAARSKVQFGQQTLDGEVITPGVFGAGLASPVVAGSGGGSGGGGGGGGTETFRKDQAETLKAASEAQNLLNEAMRGGSEAMEEYSKAQERAEQMAQLLKAAREEGITLSAKEVEALEDALLAQDRLTEKAEEIKQAYDAIKDAAGEFGSATGKALADSLFGIGSFNDALKASFKDLVSTILAELGKLAANKLLLMLLGSAGGGAGDGGGLFGGGGGGFKIPGFAGGGSHSGGLRIVGENGPEIEATGASRIHSTSDLRGMMKPTTNVIINNNAPNVQVETSERDDGSVEVLISATQRATADGVLRGTGDLSKALETTYGLTRRGR